MAFMRLYMAVACATRAATASGHDVPRLQCDLLKACMDPSSCEGLTTQPPEHFDIPFNTTAGRFSVQVTTAWAPPMAARHATCGLAWDLARLGYWQGARFYRVCSHPEPAFVVQFGYKGQPEVDKCWDDKRTSNVTWPPQVPPGNTRGAVSWSMNAYPAGGPNCTSDKYCARGFSTNIFVNLGNNSRLDPSGFAPIGVISDEGMSTVDSLFYGYGEVCDLCDSNSTDPYCVGTGPACRGCDMDTLLSE
eukprot:gene4140-4464_t